MFKPSLSSILCASAVSLLLMTKAHAGDLREVFDYYKANPAGSYSNDQMKGWAGPSFTVKSKLVEPRLLTVRAPTWNSSCGQIDFFAGSFSIVTKDELVQMARGIAAGAPSYFFNLAIAAVCPSCKEEMAEIARKLETWNEMARDTCGAAWEQFHVTADLTKKAEELGKSKGLSLDLLSGAIPDYGSSMTEFKDWWSTSQLDQTKVNSTGSVADEAVSDTSIIDDILPKELLASIFGTVIIKPNETGDKPQFIPYDPTIDFVDMLFNAEGDTINILKCPPAAVDPECLTLIETPREFKGLTVSIKEMVSGNNADCPGILNAIFKDKALCPDQDAFYRNSRFGWQKVVLEHKDDPAIFDVVGEYWSYIVAKEQLAMFYFQYRQAMINASLPGVERHDMVTPEEIMQRVEAANVRYEVAVTELDKKIDTLAKSYTMLSALKTLSRN